MVSGTFDPEESVRRFRDVILVACQLKDLTEVLIDCRELGGRGMAFREMTYASRIAALYRSHLRDGGSPFRLAYVANDAFGGWSPGADVAAGQGLDVYITTDIDAARAWLDT